MASTKFYNRIKNTCTVTDFWAISPTHWNMMLHVWHHLMQPVSVLCSLKIQATGGKKWSRAPLWCLSYHYNLCWWAPLFTVTSCWDVLWKLPSESFCSSIPIMQSVADKFVSCRIFCISVWEFNVVATYLYYAFQVWHMQPRFRLGYGLECPLFIFFFLHNKDNVILVCC